MTTCQQLCRKAARYGEVPHEKRGGSVTLEFLLVFPVLLIVLLAAIEFGMFFANMQQVALACRVGAEEASQTGSLPNSGVVPTNITDAISQQLTSSGITYCTVVLQHNVNGPAVTLTTPNLPPFTPPSPNLPGQTPPDYGRLSVQVMVYVPMTELAPNCLAAFGFTLAGRSARCSTTFRYEG